MKEKINVFLTGAGGNMGGAALEMFVTPEQKARVNLTLLDLPTEANCKKLQPYADQYGVNIIWGDLTNYEDVLRAVNGADYVLHAAAVIPPLADHDPDLAWRVNVGAAENIVRAIKAQPDPDTVKLVNIGTVAETGDRLAPIHVGRTGDPVLPSVFDYYACTKIEAERIVAESGLKYWVSLRQTFILTTETKPVPIMFHMPLDTCFEACSLPDAGRVLVNATGQDLPEDFWRRFYNIGGGAKSRGVFRDFLRKSIEITTGQKMKDVFERRWFTLRNFHCQWYQDSDVLNAYLDHQHYGIDDFFKDLKANTPWMQRAFTRLIPKKIIKEKVFKPLAFESEDSTMRWAAEDPEKFAAFYKDQASFESIPAWGAEDQPTPTWDDHLRLDHGYDEAKPAGQLDLEDMHSAAEFRGGACLAQEMKAGDLHTPLTWGCAFGHEFQMTPNSVLKGGHWCPECTPPAWNFDQQARLSPFIAQVWRHQHTPDEDNHYPLDADLLIGCQVEIKQ
ncbi:MAG: NAD-dependent epimerase/dehydratase family protein [Chloroflexota bacterium]